MPERIEELVAKHGISYYQLAKAMGLSRNSVHAVRNGKREATQKFITKLDISEQRIKAGTPIKKEGNEKQPLLLFAVNSAMPAGELLAAPNRVTTELRPTDTVPKPGPIEVNLVRPTMAKGLQRIMAALRQNECDELLLECLSDPHASHEFIEKMTPTSYLWALKKCVILILGPEWHKELQRIVNESEKQAQMD